MTHSLQESKITLKIKEKTKKKKGQKTHNPHEPKKGKRKSIL
jgi:hypothetical protein